MSRSVWDAAEAAQEHIAKLEAENAELRRKLVAAEAGQVLARFVYEEGRALRGTGTSFDSPLQSAVRDWERAQIRAEVA